MAPTQPNPPVGSYKLTLRPWVGYANSAEVEVESFDALLAKARDVVGAGPRQLVKLYHVGLNAEGLPVDKETRKHVTSVYDLDAAGLEGGGVVWICVGGSPMSSPQKQKPRSPFLVDDLASVGFKVLPELYEDDALKAVTEELLLHAQDPFVLVMMAIPGSGKTRTVVSACAKADIVTVRIKLLDDSLGVIHKCISDARRDPRHDVASYEDWKSVLRPVITKLLRDKLGDAKGLAGLRVLHLDEAQTLMGNAIVSRTQWDATCEPWNMVMPTVCAVLQSLLNHDRNLRCVVSGTNFFAPLVLSTGSEAKTAPVALSGTFPPKWVMSNLVNKYFRVPANLSDNMLEHVTFLSGNRRAIQHFLVFLKRAVEGKREGDELFAEELCNARRDAFREWSRPIADALRGTRGVAVLAMAAIVYPEAFSGRRVDGTTIKFPLESLPDAVKDFGLAGGINLNVSAGTVSVSIPQGCVWEFMGSLVGSATALWNVKEVEAFVRAAKSVDTQTGCAFERLFACELSMMDLDGQCPLYKRIARVWGGKGTLVPDPLVFGQPFVYESRIRDVEWCPHQVYCVQEKAADVGKRVVDVGFPMWVVTDTGGAKEQARIMCELKKGYACAELWRLCWKYFEEMRDYAARNPNVIVCFVASSPFLNGTPDQRAVKKGISAHDSRAACLQLMAHNSRFMALDDVKLHSRFPLGQIFEGMAEPDVEPLVDGLSNMYLGTPSKDERK